MYAIRSYYVIEYKHLKWGNYQLGVAYVLQQAGYNIAGCDTLFHGTVPYGAGLSSSASNEVATAITLLNLGGNDMPKLEDVAVMCQKAENEYVGMNCGIMDQFVITSYSIHYTKLYEPLPIVGTRRSGWHWTTGTHW